MTLLRQHMTIIGARPKYVVYDREKRRVWAPIYKAFDGNLDDLLLSPQGDLCRHTLRGLEHESVFSDRFVVTAHLDNFRQGLN